jgi:hypothetical protein
MYKPGNIIYYHSMFFGVSPEFIIMDRVDDFFVSIPTYASNYLPYATRKSPIYSTYTNVFCEADDLEDEYDIL